MKSKSKIPTGLRTWISSVNLAYDNTSGSTLNVSGSNYTSSLTAYEAATFKISVSNPGSDFMKPRQAGVTARGPWSNPDVANSNRAQIFLNPSYNWSDRFDRATLSLDTQTIVLHELGHAHGLAHPNSQNFCADGGALSPAEIDSVMHGDGRIKRTLTTDDLNGLALLY